MKNEFPLPSISRPSFVRIRRILDKLGQAQPQALLLEGGRERERFEAAIYWAARCNCKQADPPCLNCDACRRILACEHPNLHLYDGRISNKDDQDAPGLVRAFTVDNTRLLKRKLHEAPHDTGCRVVAIMGIERDGREEAANAMLKLLEDPLPGVVFTLLTPQREQLLPTLVSRSFCLTLPWDKDTTDASPETAAWEKKLALFLREGKGFLEDTATRGAMDVNLAQNLLLACQRAIASAMSGGGAAVSQPDPHLHQAFSQGHSGCPPSLLHQLTQASAWIFEAQEALAQNVTPARIMEALAARLFVLFR